MLIRYILRASYGNDSIALIQWAREEGLTDVAVVYSDTGWSRAWWTQRVEQMETWVSTLGFMPARTESIGMEELLKSKKMWPQRLMQFCTKELKMVPMMAWLEKNDPERRAIILTGIRVIARKETPSAIIWRVWARFSGGSLFMDMIMRHHARTVKHNLTV
jgi:hypothetical protein